jgi:hypothetical protein
MAFHTWAVNTSSLGKRRGRRRWSKMFKFRVSRVHADKHILSCFSLQNCSWN